MGKIAQKCKIEHPTPTGRSIDTLMERLELPESPQAMVAGLWIIMVDTGDMRTLVPAIAMTDAALAAMPSRRNTS